MISDHLYIRREWVQKKKRLSRGGPLSTSFHFLLTPGGFVSAHSLVWSPLLENGKEKSFCLGSISAAFSNPVFILPQEETAGRMSGKARLWSKFLIKILTALLVARNVIWKWSLAGPHVTPTAHYICTCTVFTTSSFNFGLPTYFVSHYCYRRALYAVFYSMSKVTHLLVCIMLTP